VNVATTINNPRLGALVKEYKLSTGRVREIIIYMLISGVMASCFFLPAIFSNDVSRSGITTRIGVMIPGTLFLLPVVVGISRLLHLRGNSLCIYENGLTFRSRYQVFETTWDDIDSLIQESACRITKKNGDMVEFGANIENVEEVEDEIQEKTLQRIYPAMIAAIRSGSTVQFIGIKPFQKSLVGKGLNNFSYASAGFAVDAQGITQLEDGQRIAWNDVTDFGIAQEKMGKALVNVFFVQSNEARFRTRLGLLSNAHVLLALCQELTGGK
jgi:hypothetical protein